MRDPAVPDSVAQTRRDVSDILWPWEVEDCLQVLWAGGNTV